MKIDRDNTYRMMGLFLYLLSLLCLITFLSSCGVAEKMCPRDTFHAGCNTLVGEEKADLDSMEEIIKLLDKKIELIQLHLDNLPERNVELEDELEELKDELYLFQNSVHADLNIINAKLNAIIKRMVAKEK